MGKTMESKHAAVVKDLIRSFEKNPSQYDGTKLKDLIMERKNLADRERKYVAEMRELQSNIAKQMSDASREYMKLKGAIDYVEEQMIGAIPMKEE